MRASVVRRYHNEGAAGLLDRAARPRRSPTRTPGEVEAHVLQVRREQRRGQDWIGAELGIPPRTVGAILLRHHGPVLHVVAQRIVDGARSTRRAIARTPPPSARKSAISSGSTKDE